MGLVNALEQELEVQGYDPDAGILAGDGQYMLKGLERAARAVFCLGSGKGSFDTMDS